MAVFQAGAQKTSPVSDTCTLEVGIDGAIGPATLDLFERANKKAAAENCGSLLLLINTPGGSLQTTRMLVEEILQSPRPVLCLIYPSGAHAGSAGAIIMQACHVNGAMVATNIGAATPIAGGGQQIPEDLRKKLINDTVSWIDGLTTLRGRDQQFGRDIVTEAKAVSAEEALKINAIDHVAETKKAFLDFADGRQVKMPGDQVEAVSIGALKTFAPDMRHKVVAFFTDPQIAYLLLMASLALLYFEITHPGTLVPGVIGGVGLVISMVSLHKLNVTWGGLALMLLGVVLMIAEAFVPSFGILGIGGIAAFFLGGVFLFDPSHSGVALPMDLLIVTTAIVGLIMMGLSYLAYKTLGVKKRGEFSDMIGQEGRVVEVKTEPHEEILVETVGEIWKVKCDHALKEGDLVEVIGHKGLTLNVKLKSDT
ncbi:MAG: nodulation protein NfeD [Pseudobdellovibrionaceae bacterium]|nr:nodulation protein NfeD [Bdellovibrionales bacterium]USN48958.1 MAG: nodulation protein NfeD [Pseudobdellovibrionaceae bacterium]